MHLERYEYEAKRTFKEYFFYSEGPKGRILKVVRFVLFRHAPPVYDLVLGDWDEERRRINDTIKTNNADVQKVLATVAMIVFCFTDIFRRSMVRFSGSNLARTRLYQININKFLDEIQEEFEVLGYIHNRLEPFQKKVNYDGFLITRKGNIIPKEYLILEEQTEIYMTSSRKKDKKEKRIYNDRIVDGPELVDIENDPAVLRKVEAGRRMFDNCTNLEEVLKRFNLR